MTDIGKDLQDAFMDGYRYRDAEIVRCRDCKWLSMTTLGMEYACWHGAEKVWGETGEHKDHTVCQRIDSLDHYCSYGERRSE